MPEKAAEIIIDRFVPGNHSIVQMFRGMVGIKEKVIR
jgi:hypothetical protein